MSWRLENEVQEDNEVNERLISTMACCRTKSSWHCEWYAAGPSLSYINMSSSSSIEPHDPSCRVFSLFPCIPRVQNFAPEECFVPDECAEISRPSEQHFRAVKEFVSQQSPIVQIRNANLKRD